MIKNEAFSGEYKIKATGEVKKLVRVYDETQQENLRVFEAIAGGKWVGFEDPETGIFYKGTDVECLPPPEPFEEYGIECEHGWDELLKPLFDYIEKFNKENPGNEIIISQVKEKFGGLRFYVDNSTPELDKMIEEACADSFNVCETCGSRENVGITGGSWYSTVCESCLIERSKNRPDRKFVWKNNSTNEVFTVLDGKMEKLQKKNEE